MYSRWTRFAPSAIFADHSTNWAIGRRAGPPLEQGAPLPRRGPRFTPLSSPPRAVQPAGRSATLLLRAQTSHGCDAYRLPATKYQRWQRKSGHLLVCDTRQQRSITRTIGVHPALHHRLEFGRSMTARSAARCGAPDRSGVPHQCSARTVEGEGGGPATGQRVSAASCLTRVSQAHVIVLKLEPLV